MDLTTFSPEQVAYIAALAIALVKLYFDNQGKKDAEFSVSELMKDLEMSNGAIQSLLKIRDNYRTAKADGTITDAEKIKFFDEAVPALDMIDLLPTIDTTRSA